MKVNIISGFLGSGKTTLIQRILQSLAGHEKVAVLVNEFGKIGIDGEILRQQHVDVVELSQGCICCSLRTDLVKGIEEIYYNFKPDRLLIEPSGIAAPALFLPMFAEEPLSSIINLESLTVIIDLSKFFNSTTGLSDFYQGMIKAAQILVLNKADLVTPVELSGIQEVVKEINPTAKLLVSSYGDVPLAEVLSPQATIPCIAEEGHVHFDSYSAIDREHYFDELQLRQVFTELGNGTFGNILRAKGIFRIPGKALLIEFVFGEVSVQELPIGENSRWAIIGKNIDEDRIAETIKACKGDVYA